MADQQDTDKAVIPFDDDSLTFEGDDLEFPTSPDLYGDDPKSKHTDFDLGKGSQNVDGVKFDVGSITKGVLDGVTATAKAVSDVSKAKAASPTAPTPPSTPPTTPGTTKPSSSPAPVAPKSGSSGGAAVAVGLGLATLVVIGLAARRPRRRMSP